MTTLQIDRKHNGILVPLSDVVRILPVSQVSSVVLKDFRLHFGSPLGIPLQEFELRTKAHDGLLLNSKAFEDFAKTNMQIIDGTIIFDLRTTGGNGRLIVECIDASIWELSADSAETVELLNENNASHGAE